MIIVDAEQTGKNIRHFRKEKGIGAKQFSKMLNVNYPVLFSWESGVRVPSLEMMYNICEVLGVKMDLIVSRKGV